MYIVHKMMLQPGDRIRLFKRRSCKSRSRSLESLRLSIDDGSFCGRVRKTELAAGDLGIVHSVKGLEVPLDVADNGGDSDGINVLVTTEDVPPDGARENGVALDETLIVGSEHTAPLDEEVFEVLVAHATGGNVVHGSHAVFGSVEIVV